MTHQELWVAYRAVDPDAGEDYEAWSFGDDPDTLAASTRNGIKTATASAGIWYEMGEEPMPRAGEYSVILDSRDQAVCVIRTTRVYTVPFDQVSARHAWREGEGDRSLAHWRRVHEAFFRAELGQAGLEFSLDMPVVCEEFELVYPDTGGVQALFEKWCGKLRLVPDWDVRLELVSDPNWRKTGDLKVDCDDKKAILMLAADPKQENLEEVIVHELMHLKLYPLDQVTESLILSQFEEGTPACAFAYRQFFLALEQTVEELTKCWLLEFGEDKQLSFGRCERQRSFTELYDGLKDLE